MTFLNALSAPSFVSSAPIPRAVSMNRFDCSGSSCVGFGFAVMRRSIVRDRGKHQRLRLPRPPRSGNSSCFGHSGFDAMSCPIGQPLASRAANSNLGALHVINAKADAVVHAEVEFRQISVNVLLAHVLVDADKAAFEQREIAFERVGVHSSRTHSDLEWSTFSCAAAGGYL